MFFVFYTLFLKKSPILTLKKGKEVFFLRKFYLHTACFIYNYPISINFIAINKSFPY